MSLNLFSCHQQQINSENVKQKKSGCICLCNQKQQQGLSKRLCKINNVNSHTCTYAHTHTHKYPTSVKSSIFHQNRDILTLNSFTHFMNRTEQLRKKDKSGYYDLFQQTLLLMKFFSFIQPSSLSSSSLSCLTWWSGVFIFLPFSLTLTLKYNKTLLTLFKLH